MQYFYDLLYLVKLDGPENVWHKLFEHWSDICVIHISDKRLFSRRIQVKVNILEIIFLLISRVGENYCAKVSFLPLHFPPSLNTG